MTNTIDYINMNKDNKSLEKSDRALRAFLLSLLMTAILGFSVKIFARGIDKHIRNQDIMFCESALISRNPDYLQKCQCYYDNENIDCLKGGE